MLGETSAPAGVGDVSSFYERELCNVLLQVVDMGRLSSPRQRMDIPIVLMRGGEEKELLEAE